MALNTDFKEIEKSLYIDDYEKSDEIYNYIRQNNIKNINIGMLYPLENDKNIPLEYKYRAIYDNYTKHRFNYDCTIYINEFISIDFIKNLSDFANKLLIIKVTHQEKQQTENELNQIYEKTFNLKINNDIYLIALNKNEQFVYNITTNNYKNFNRGEYADTQTKLIMDLIKKHKMIQ